MSIFPFILEGQDGFPDHRTPGWISSWSINGGQDGFTKEGLGDERGTSEESTHPQGVGVRGASERSAPRGSSARGGTRARET